MHHNRSHHAQPPLKMSKGYTWLPSTDQPLSCPHVSSQAAKKLAWDTVHMYLRRRVLVIDFGASKLVMSFVTIRSAVQPMRHSSDLGNPNRYGFATFTNFFLVAAIMVIASTMSFVSNTGTHCRLLSIILTRERLQNEEVISHFETLICDTKASCQWRLQRKNVGVSPKLKPQYGGLNLQTTK